MAGMISKPASAFVEARMSALLVVLIYNQMMYRPLSSQYS